MRNLWMLTSWFMVSCAVDLEPEEHDSAVGLGSAQYELSYTPGCHFYVGSNYGGQTLWMARSTTISDLRTRSMGDKISSLRLLGGATTTMWIDRNYNGNSWYINENVETLHASSWENLGDNASSIDCY